MWVFCSFFFLLFFNRLAASSSLHSLPCALLSEVFLNSLSDCFNVHLRSAGVESLKKKVVFDIFKYLFIDASQSHSSSKPGSLPIVVIAVIVFPDPSSAVGGELALVERLLTGRLDDLWINLDLLLSAAGLNNGLRNVELQLFLLFFGQAKLSTLLGLLLFLKNVGSLLIVDIFDKKHGFVGGELRND